MPDIFLVGKIRTSFACDGVGDVRFYSPFDQSFLAKTSSDIVGKMLCDLPANLKFK